MKESAYNDRRFVVKMLVKGIVLGVLCCTCFMAQANLQIFWNAASRPLLGQPWSLEDVTAEFSRGGETGTFLEQLKDSSNLVSSIFIITICSLFGLWAGLRLRQINRLREEIRLESNRALATNKQLRELSLTDPLTRLANRRCLFDQLEKEIKRSERFGQSLSCMMLDLDFFKNVNDTYGHQFGDYVLREIGAILKSQCRGIETIARYGGEEFAIIMPNTSLESAKVLAERLRKKISSSTFSKGEISTKLTVSIGLSCWTPEHPVDGGKLLSMADMALYEVKVSGKDAVLSWNKSHKHITRKIRRKYLDERRMDDLRKKLDVFSRDLKQSYLSAVNSLLSAVKIRDNYTLAHSYEVSYYALAISRKMGLSEAETEVINNAANLHDIGKIGIDEKILCKPGKLSKKEMEVMKEHPRMAADILKPLKHLSKEIAIIVHHHERYDGAGYPHGLKGEAIPLGARIISVADAFSAMLTERPYKKAIAPEKALQELQANAGSQFDPKIVKAFVEIFKSGKITIPRTDAHSKKLNAMAG